MDGKSILASKVFWFNVLALVVLVSNAFGYAEFQADAQLDVYATVIITLINVALRVVTKRPVLLVRR